MKLEPSVSVFNVFNWANFGGAGNQLSGVLDGAPGSSLNNASSADTAATQPRIALRGWTGFWPARAHMRTEPRGNWSSKFASRSSAPILSKCVLIPRRQLEFEVRI